MYNREYESVRDLLEANKEIIMTNDDTKRFEEAKECSICRNERIPIMFNVDEKIYSYSTVGSICWTVCT